MMKRKATIIAAILIIILALFGKRLLEVRKESPRRAQSKKLAKAVHVDTVIYMNHKIKVTAYGRLVAKERIDIFSEVSGTLLKGNLYFKVGNSFRKGQPLLKIDDRDTRLNLYAQKSDFLSLLTQLLPDIKSDFPKSYDNWNNYLKQFDIEKPLDSLPNISSLKEKYFLAARNIFKLYYSNKSLELRLSKYIIIAPFAGTVTQNLIEAGSLVRAGQKLGEFASINNYELEVAVNSDEIQLINLKSQVKITADEIQLNEKVLPLGKDVREIWKGEVTRISKHIDPNSQTVKVFINVWGDRLMEGMYLKAEIDGKVVENVFEVPRRAIVDNNFIYTIKDSLFGKKKINILKLYDLTALINGLDSGTVVVSEPLTNVRSVVRY